MICQRELFEIIVKGRSEAFIKGGQYKETNGIYKKHCELQIGEYKFTDSYRGYNPYSGVEYLYLKDESNPIWHCDYIGYVNVDSPVSDKNVYEFLVDARGSHLINCHGNLNMNYIYEKGLLRYETIFKGDMNNLLQFENFYHKDVLIAQQITGGRVMLD